MLYVTIFIDGVYIIILSLSNPAATLNRVAMCLQLKNSKHLFLDRKEKFWIILYELLCTKKRPTS